MPGHTVLTACLHHGHVIPGSLFPYGGGGCHHHSPEGFAQESWVCIVRNLHTHLHRPDRVSLLPSSSDLGHASKYILWVPEDVWEIHSALGSSPHAGCSSDSTGCTGSLHCTGIQDLCTWAHEPVYGWIYLHTHTYTEVSPRESIRRAHLGAVWAECAGR
jgi:hypothetical protein